MPRINRGTSPAGDQMSTGPSFLYHDRGFSMNHLTKYTVFITGCSSGIGHDTMRALSQRGHRVIASCRKEKDVQTLISLGYDAVLMDVDNSVSIVRAFAEVLMKTEGRLDVLINNAGYAQPGALEDLSREVLRAQFETNVFGLMELTNLAIPIMRQQGRGRIINISSLNGLISLSFHGAYSASKYAVEGLCDTLRLELKSSGIDVICIEPGPIESQIRENAVQRSLEKINFEHSYFSLQYQQMLSGFQLKKAHTIFTKKTDVVVDKLIHAIESSKPKAKYPVTFVTYFFIWIKRILSTKMLDHVLAYVSKKAY